MQGRGFVLPSHYSIQPIVVKNDASGQFARSQKAKLSARAGSSTSSSLPKSPSKTPRSILSKAPPVAGKYQAASDVAEFSEITAERGRDEYNTVLPPVFDKPTREVVVTPRQGYIGPKTRQANRVLLKSFGHLLDKVSLKFDEGFPGQMETELALLPPPFIDIWKLMPPSMRPEPKVLTSWMAKRGMRMNEAFAERVLTDGKNPILEPWPETISSGFSSGRQSSLLFSLVYDDDDSVEQFDLSVWICHVLQQRGMTAAIDDIRRTDGPELDVRWLVAMVLWLGSEKLEDLNMRKLPTPLQYGFLGFLPMLRILDLSENRVLKSENLEILGNCMVLEKIVLSKCGLLTTLKQLNSCRKLKTIWARDCLGFKATEADTEPLISSTTVTDFDLHESDAVRCLTIELPAVTYLDLSYYDVLERVRGHLLQLDFLDMSFDPEMYIIREDVFSGMAPNLQELHLRSCDALERIEDLGAATKLQVLRVCCCPRLQTLFDAKRAGSRPLCPMLRFVDAHNCPMLQEQSLWGIVKQRVTSIPVYDAEDNAKKKLLQNVGFFRKGEVVSVEDFWIQEEGDVKRMRYLVKSLSTGNQGYLYADEDGEVFISVGSDDEDKICGIVWPTKAQAEKFTETLSKDVGKNFIRATSTGVRRKLRDAVEFGRDHPKPREAEAKEELDHGITRMLEALRPQDYSLVRSAMCEGGVPALLPDRNITCFLGCGQEMPAEKYSRHETHECPARRVLASRKIVVPKIGGPSQTIGNDVGIKTSDRELFNQRADDLQAKLRTWNPEPLKHLLQEIDASDPQYFKDATRTACWARQRRLEDKYKVVQPLLKKGNIHVDFDKCTVDILVSIAFAARKPPDTSAEFEQKGYAQAMDVLQDLSVVISAYRTPMIVEGHTGQVEPREYWEALAQNRSALIVQSLQKDGVPRGLCTPVGCPGGGAKVLVYPDKEKQTD